METKPITVTSQGRKVLGDTLRDYREKKYGSLDAAIEVIKERTGKKLSKSTLGDLENAATKRVTLDTLLVLSQAGWGGMNLDEMIETLTDRRLAVCEAGSQYNV